MITMVHVALIALTLVVVVFAARAFRSAYRKKLGNLFFDLGIALTFAFATLVLASVGTTRFAAFVDASTVATIGIWVVLALGLMSLVLVTFIDTLIGSVKARRKKRLDKKKASDGAPDSSAVPPKDWSTERPSGE